MAEALTGWRTRLVAIAGAGLFAAAFAIVVAAGSAAPAAIAGFDEGLPDLRVTLTGPTEPVPKGKEATYAASVTNHGTAASQPDTQMHLYALKASSHDPAQNPFRSVASSGGSCVQGNGIEGEYFCSTGSIEPGASVQVNATVEVNESMRFFASVGSRDSERGMVNTLVAAPPEASGSKKIKVSGLPSSACPGDFKMKATAKRAEKISATLYGPLDEAFKPVAGTAKEKLASEKGASLTAKVPVRSLEPAYYEIQLLAKFPGGPKQKAAVAFQRC